MTRHRRPKPRPFTEAERAEAARLQRDGFTGRAVDVDRALALYEISPAEYKAIGKRVREQERFRMRML